MCIIFVGLMMKNIDPKIFYPDDNELYLNYFN